MAYEYEWKVNVGNTDFSGLIYAPEAVDALATAVQDLFATLGYPPSEAQASGIIYPAVHIDIDYLDSIRLDDVVLMELTPSIGDASVSFHTTGTVRETQVIDGTITHVFIDEETYEPVSIPDEIRAGLQSYCDD